jgi:23S rRNA pseudouridine2605 synthase
MDRHRARLLEHVRRVQGSIRTCEGCGLCCTEAFNSVRILPIEGRRIAAHLGALPAARAAELLGRARDAVRRFRLRPGPARQAYTCPFLEPDATCALPFDVKPVACLAFNPVTAERCEMQDERFDAAHAAQEAANRAAGLASRRHPIPVAVLAASESAPRATRVAAGRGLDATGGRPHPLPRVLSKWHVASRKHAEELVRAGRVTVNGALVTDVTRVVRPDRDRVAVDGAEVGRPAEAAYVWVAVNKPRGVVSTTSDPEGRPTVLALARGHAAAGLAPVGRLDRDSAGLILLTNDHALAARLLDPKRHVRKVYRVKVRGRITPETVERMRTEQVRSDDLDLGPCDVGVESVGPRSTWLRISLTEGKNRQIRRQCSAFGHEVETIVRMAFGPIALGDLRPGATRSLTPDEVAALRSAP